MNEQKTLRICLAASAGGHASQLVKLSQGWCGYDTFCVTTTQVVRNRLREYGRVYVVGECNRQHPVRVFMVLIRCIWIAFKERPDVVISTGAAVGCLMCLLCKMLGAKVVWIDSITNVDKISLSGRMVHFIADLFLVQWPELAGRYKNAEFVGAVI